MLTLPLIMHLLASILVALGLSLAAAAEVVVEERSERIREASPDEMEITISDIPGGLRNIYIPLQVSSRSLRLLRPQVKDNLLGRYAAEIVTTEEGLVKGLSVGSIEEAELPGRMVVEMVPGFAGRETTSVRIRWQEPWVYSQVADKLPSSSAGFSGIYLFNGQGGDPPRCTCKRTNLSNEFFLQIFGQTAITERSSKLSQGNESPHPPLGHYPEVRNLEFAVNTPTRGTYKDLYVPLYVANDRIIQAVTRGANFPNGVTLRMLDGNVLEISSISGRPLPKDQRVSGDLIVRVADANLPNVLKVGPVLSRSARLLPAVSVTLSTNSISTRESFEILDLFNL